MKLGKAELQQHETDEADFHADRVSNRSYHARDVGALSTSSRDKSDAGSEDNSVGIACCKVI